MKNSPLLTFARSDFLLNVRQSLGICLGLPDPKDKARLEITQYRICFEFREKSLLEVRDRLRSRNHGHRLHGQSEVIGYLKDIVLRFHWILIPHREEILSWPKQTGVQMIKQHIIDWQKMSQETPTGLVVPWHMKSDQESLQNVSMAVLASLFEELPEHSYQQLLSMN
ncbi:MAG: hypothetical protein RLY66_659 [Candidatus Parcubacteria bacterium]|jgi:hypothetical protein